jgi:serine/threonine-protein kinase
MEPTSGLQVTESVRLVRQLGEGGMGSVWLADHLTLRTQVAVKFMSWQLARSGEAAARFSREASAAAQIKSPHVVQIFDYGLLEGQLPYIVMELLEGETLQRYIARHGGRLSFVATAHIVSQVCKALSRAHAQQVIHRDIKPDNIFVADSDGEPFVKLLDFGVAKQMGAAVNMTSTGAVVGTAYYMSPEQMLSSKHVDARADLWAVGVVTYQCVTGVMPFEAETFAGVAVRVAEGRFAMPYAEHGIGSRLIDDWFARALARDVAARFASARELADGLSSAVARGVSTGRPPPPFDASSTLVSPLSDGPSGAAPGATPAPRTFAGMASTQHGIPGRRRNAFGVVVAVALGAILLGAGVFGLVVLTRSRSSPTNPEAARSSASLPVEAASREATNAAHRVAPSAEATAAPLAVPVLVVPPTAGVVEKADSVTKAPPTPSPAKKNLTQKRPVEAPPAREPSRPSAQLPTVRDRGF